jgi:hypothetical protein
MDDNSVERTSDYAEKAALGFGIGMLLGWAYARDPQGFWRWVWYAYLIASALWIMGASDPSLPTDVRIFQAALATPAVVILVMKALRRSTS